LSFSDRKISYFKNNKLYLIITLALSLAIVSAIIVAVNVINNEKLLSCDLFKIAKEELKDSDIEEKRNFIERIAAEYTCPPANRKAYCQKHYNSNAGNADIAHRKIQRYYYFLGQLASDRNVDFIEIVFEHIKYIPFEHLTSVSFSPYYLSEVLIGPDVEKSAALMVRLGLVGSPEEITFIPMFGHETRYLTVNSVIVGRMKHEFNSRKVLTKCGDSFGKKLIQGIIESKPSMVAEAVSGNIEAIKKLPVQKQSDIIGFIKEAINKPTDFDKVKESAGFSQWYEHVLETAVNDEYEEFMGVSASDFLSRQRFDSDFYRSISRIALTVIDNPAKFYSLMDHADKLYIEGTKLGKFRKVNGKYREHFIHQFAGGAAQCNTVIIARYYLDTVRGKGTSQQHPYSHEMKYIFNAYINDNRNDINSGNINKVFAGLVELSGRIYGKGNASAGFINTAHVFIDYCKTTDDISKHIESLQQLKKESSYPNIIDEMIMSFKHLLLYKGIDDSEKKPLTDEIAKYYLNVLNNEELSRIWRIAVCNHLNTNMNMICRNSLITDKMINIQIQNLKAGTTDNIHAGNRFIETIVASYNKLEMTDLRKRNANTLIEMQLKHFESKPYTDRYFKETDLLQIYTQLHFRVNGSENAGQVDRILKIAGNRIWNIHEIIPLMVNSGLIERARNATLANKGSWRWSPKTTLSMNSGLEEKSAAFIEGFENPEDILLAKVIMWTRHDGGDRPNIKEKDRVTQIANEYLNATEGYGSNLDNRTYKEIFKTLMHNRFAYVRPVLKERIFESVKDKNLPDLLAQERYSSSSFYNRVIFAYMSKCIGEGNIEPLLKMVNEMDTYYNLYNDRDFIQMTHLISVWTEQLLRKLKGKKLPKEDIEASFQLFQLAYDKAVKLDSFPPKDPTEQPPANRLKKLFVREYAISAMAAGKMNLYLDQMHKLDEKTQKNIFQHTRYNGMNMDMVFCFSKGNISPENFCKGIYEISNSKYYQKDLKSSFRETESIYAYITKNHRFPIKTLLKYLETNDEYFKPLDLAYLHFRAKNPAKAIEACNKGINQAKTDLESATCIVHKGLYSKDTDPKTYNEAWTQIQPYKDKLDNRLKGKFDKAFIKKTRVK